MTLCLVTDRQDSGIVQKGINAAVHTAKIHAGLTNLPFNKTRQRSVYKYPKRLCPADEGAIGRIQSAFGPVKENAG